MTELHEGELAKVFDQDRYEASLLAYEAGKPQEWEQVQRLNPSIFAYGGYVGRSDA